ncbi:polysaccharide deacetylase family protein [Pelosinus sp. sgz500959]|uniref:polysaccharide deacetylase family protein n=1 Tax=Pelosinus sp. sgz500959 TaxID=3242472 RepID=UPI00366C52A8
MLSRRSFIKMCASTFVSVSYAELLFQVPTSSGSGNRQIPVLVYHRVGYTTDNFTVTPERFTTDLETLQYYGYCAISLEQMQSFLEDRNIEMPDKPILITFDDGYLDNFENAYPILKKHNMIATFFIITDKLWTPDRLTPQRIVEMAEGGMSFGSHTVTHRRLGELTWEEIREELTISKAVLESVLGKTVTAIAYPQGSYNDNVITLAKNLGYTTGFTVREGICRKESPEFELRRIPIFKYDGGIRGVIANRGGI